MHDENRDIRQAAAEIQKELNSQTLISAEELLRRVKLARNAKQKAILETSNHSQKQFNSLLSLAVNALLKLLQKLSITPPKELVAYCQPTQMDQKLADLTSQLEQRDINQILTAELTTNGSNQLLNQWGRQQLTNITMLPEEEQAPKVMQTLLTLHNPAALTQAVQKTKCR